MNVRSGVMLIALLLTLPTLGGCGGGNAESSDPGSSATESGTEPQSPPASGGACKADGDCVPNECCHARDCVNQAQAPDDCHDKVCSMECAEGTMDCGAGACACQDGICAVKWSSGPKAE